jgi:ABC-2 type transport system permease protein
MEKELRLAIENPGAAGEGGAGRGAGANILGYLILVILLQGILFTGLYSEDRENGALKRIASATSGAGGYLLAQGASGFLLIFSSAFVVISSAKVIGLDVGFPLAEYAGYLSLLTLGSVAFALFVATLAQKPDDASAMASSVALLTTILAGSYHDFSSSRPVLDALLGVLPQKRFLNLVERSNVLRTLPELIYLLAAPVLLIALSAYLANRRLKTGA